MKKDLNELDAHGVKTITVISSPTKPGSGWVRVWGHGGILITLDAVEELEELEVDELDVAST